jgi:hypothetical protein
LKAEYKEWLGIAPADWPVYVATALLFLMYKADSFPVDVILALIALGLISWSCFIGMKHDPKVSRIANILKKVTYPVCLVAGIVIIYLNFTRWS